MGNSIGARKCSSFKAVSTAPSMNKTPVGNSTPPLPYPTVADLSNSVDIVKSVRFNGNPAYVLSQTTQPSCKGDDPGVCKGAKSGTLNGEVKPVKGSTTVCAGRKFVIRQGDPCTMNGGNNPGIYVTTQTPSCSIENGAPDDDTDPPIEPETPEEESWLSQWWENTKHEIGEAVEHPWEATKGALKGIANIPSDLGEMVMKGGALQGAADMEQAAAMQSLFGQTQSAERLAQAAQGVRASTDAISLPKFQMANAAQAGGDKIVTGASLLAGGAGLVKSGVRGVGALGKTAASVEGQAVKGVAETGKVLQGEKALVEGAKAADTTADAGKAAGAVEVGTANAKPAGDGVKIVERIKSLREQYLGRTPKKSSRTGKEVQERMRTEGKLREDPFTGKKEFQASDGKWYDLKDADMAHKTDAVTWWNQTGRQYGAKAPEVRKWMLDSNNYTLDHYSINRSLGAKIGETYLPPLK